MTGLYGYVKRERDHFDGVTLAPVLLFPSMFMAGVSDGRMVVRWRPPCLLARLSLSVDSLAPGLQFILQPAESAVQPCNLCWCGYLNDVSTRVGKSWVLRHKEISTSVIGVPFRLDDLCLIF